MAHMMTLPKQANEWWEVLQRRDKSAAGGFIYAVVTTGVYCHPACPSRLPKRENVRFFTSNEEAERAGFRPCKRCRPNAVTLVQQQANKIAEACALIENSEDAPNFGAIADAVGMSRHHFHRVFKAVTGLAPGAYFKALRERRAMNGLRRGTSVTEVIYEAGYNSSSRFYESLAPKLGLTPSAFAKGGAGNSIRFAVGECSLGSILVAATEKGVCAIELGDRPEALVKDFEDRFPNAELVGGDRDFERLVAEVVGFVEEPERGLGLPLHVRGTAFQHRVWQILKDIPAGKTATYAEIAAKAGMPKAVRAVASAIASNKLAVAIPCHRVIRTGGALSGYRWGVERKAALLAREAAK